MNIVHTKLAERSTHVIDASDAAMPKDYRCGPIELLQAPAQGFVHFTKTFRLSSRLRRKRSKAAVIIERQRRSDAIQA
ncbi:MAG: hypothetical protein ACREXW_16815 [Gammaproteobacteria bacterium]